MARRGPLKLASQPDGTLFIRSVDTGINPLVLMVDGVAYFTFGTDQTPYHKLDDIIAWFEKEVQFENGKSKELSQAVITKLKTLKEEHQ